MKTKKTHKDLDKEWSQLTKEVKLYALQQASRKIERDALYKRYREKVKEAEQGKRVGYECTCLPEVKGSAYVDSLCSYCRHQVREDWINSPG